MRNPSSFGAPVPAPRSRPVQRFLVTGARGFIGSRLVARLVADGHEVHAITRSGAPSASASRWWQVDLADAAATAHVVSAVRPDVVFHLASQACGARRLDAVVPMIRDNLLSSVSLMSAVAACAPSASLIIAGSVEEPRSVAPGHGAHSPYAAAKAASTTYATLFRDLWQLPITVLRLAMVYGPGDPNAERLLPHVVNGLLCGTPPRLSSGSRGIDWLYIDDAVDAFVAASTSPGATGAVIDIGSGTALTIRETVERVVAFAGSAVSPLFGAVADRAQDRTHVADIGPARELLGWQARVCLDEGLRRTIAWYQQPAAEPARV